MDVPDGNEGAGGAEPVTPCRASKLPQAAPGSGARSLRPSDAPRIGATGGYKRGCDGRQDTVR